MKSKLSSTLINQIGLKTTPVLDFAREALTARPRFFCPQQQEIFSLPMRYVGLVERADPVYREWVSRLSKYYTVDPSAIGFRIEESLRNFLPGELCRAGWQVKELPSVLNFIVGRESRLGNQMLCIAFAECDILQEISMAGTPRMTLLIEVKTCRNFTSRRRVLCDLKKQLKVREFLLSNIENSSPPLMIGVLVHLSQDEDFSKDNERSLSQVVTRALLRAVDEGQTGKSGEPRVLEFTVGASSSDRMIS